MKTHPAIFLFAGTLLLAIAILLSACSHKAEPTKAEHHADYYTCTMHPSVRSQDPNGKCPICGMGLVPVFLHATNSVSVGESAAPDGPHEFTVPMPRQQFIGVTYAIVSKKPLHSILRTVGTVAYDRQRRWSYVSRIEGYVQKLEVSSRGDQVEKDQPLLTIYSPDLLTTQREFLDLIHKRDEARAAHSDAALQSAEILIDSARRRLLSWNIASNQIAQLEQSGQATEALTLYSPFKGVIQNLRVDQGRRVAAGDDLVDVADLSVVQVWAQFYQDELPLLRKGAPVDLASDALPDEKFTGKIALIDPFIDEATRTTRVRIDVENPELKLRPDMYVTILLEKNLPETISVPVSAVLPTGERSLVFVDKGEGRLEPRFIKTSGQYGDDFAVNDGLKEGERVVNSANFLIDSEAKVQGALNSW